MKNNKELTLIFPNQLFYPNPILAKDRTVCLIEADRYFTDFRFHKLKLCLHRASMKAFEEKLSAEGYTVEYIEHSTCKTLEDFFSSYLSTNNVNTLYLVDPVDNKLNGQLNYLATKYNVQLFEEESPSFLCDRSWLEKFFQEKQTYLMTSFYIAQRKRLNILLDGGKPVGGKWSYDKENRKRLPKDIQLPKITLFGKNKYVTEAKDYVQKYFPKNPGELVSFFYPVTHLEAEQWLDEFLSQRLDLFGDYEDAIDKNELILYHSVLSPVMNIGLLSPSIFLKKLFDYTQTKAINLNSLEGFLRQIIGWREYIRAIYLFKGEEQRKANYFGLERKLSEAFYTAKTGIDPVDITIKKVLQYAYGHHIERLMILGNFMLLCEIHPTEVYRWFMELFIDAYDWVMVPNVFGMSQYADGGIMSTKPYISSSRYLLKMSNFQRNTWNETFDALFWYFIGKNIDLLKQNPRMTFILKNYENLSNEKLEKVKNGAESFLEKLTR